MRGRHATGYLLLGGRRGSVLDMLSHSDGSAQESSVRIDRVPHLGLYRASHARMDYNSLSTVMGTCTKIVYTRELASSNRTTPE